jgi:large subunit ribosomal protein L17
MRHLKAGRKLGRTSAHRKAMYSNMVAALVTHGKIETTEAKAKELRSIADRTISWGVGVNDLTRKDRKKLSDIERARIVHAKRMARRVLKDEAALERLFAEVAPALAGRPGGYTRVLKTRFRVGDAAPMALVALVAGGGGEAAEAPAAPAPAAKGSKKKAEAAEPRKPRKAEKPAKKGKSKKSDDDDE